MNSKIKIRICNEFILKIWLFSNENKFVENFSRPQNRNRYIENEKQETLDFWFSFTTYITRVMYEWVLGVRYAVCSTFDNKTCIEKYDFSYTQNLSDQNRFL